MKKRIKKIVKKVCVFFYKAGIKALPLQKKTIIFESNAGRNYTGNPRYIYEEMVKKNLDKTYKCVWFLEHPETRIPGNCIKVKRSRLRFFYYASVAKFFVFDSRHPKFFIKKKGNVYIQTWHGTPLKKLALDMDKVAMADSSDISVYHRNFKNNTKMWDYLISQNHYSTEIFKRCFDFADKPILEIGYPRNDVLIKKNYPEYIKKLKLSLGLPLDKKIILYAPTWRDNEYYSAGHYKFTSKLDFDKVREALSDEYIFIVKYHYLISDHIDWSGYENFIYTFDETKDIAHLYLVSDMMITDYSSVMFDYSLLKRPMLFYTYDLDDYRNNLRGFYFDFLAEAPGPVSLTTEQLIEDIKHYNADDYREKYIAFSKKYNHVDDGTASEKIVELIQSK